MAKDTPPSLDRLPTELLLKIVHLVGADSPVGSEAGVSNLVSLSRVNKVLNNACLTLLFRAVKLRFGDFGWHGKLKYVADHHADLNAQLPGMLENLRSFALDNSTTTAINDWDARSLRAFRGAATTLSYVASIASRLRKLVVIVPDSRHAADFCYLTTSAGGLQLPHVRELVVNHGSNFLLLYCENVVSFAAFRVTMRESDSRQKSAARTTTVSMPRQATPQLEYEVLPQEISIPTLGIYTAHGGPPRDLAWLLRRAESLSQLRYLELETSCFGILGHTVALPQVTHLTLRGSLRDFRLMPLVDYELRDSFPNVSKLHIVVTSNSHIPKRAWIYLKDREKATLCAVHFLNVMTNLDAIILTCAKKADRHSVCKAELSWMATAQDGGENYVFGWVSAELSLL
ncbi:hypothetical protein BKA80DRAFT_344785 [Phyllosticta citrichinensis]